MGGTSRPLGSIDGVFVLEGMLRFHCVPSRAIVPRNRTFVVDGWARDPAGLQPASRVSLLVDGAPFEARYVRRYRTDVATHFGDAAMERAGFYLVVPANRLDPGVRDLTVVLEDGHSQLSTTRVEIAPDRATLADREPSEDLAFHVDSAHSHAVRPAVEFRLEHGLPAIVRGRIVHDSADDPVELFAVIDDVDAFPAQLDAPTTPGAEGEAPEGTRFLACFTTQGLDLGEHTLQFVAAARAGDCLDWSQRIAFHVVPLCIGGFTPRFDDGLAPASIDWAGTAISAAPARPAPRSFRRGAIAHVRGWAVDPHARDAIRDAYVRFDDGTTFRMETRGARPDVADVLNMPAARYCGFVGSIATAALLSGRNAGACYVVAKDGTTAYRTNAVLEFDVTD